jgi:hypothetical protein
MKIRATRKAGRALAPDSVGLKPAPTLPPWKAFVVQFSTETGARTRVFTGRVEHLNSGRRARFASPQDLLAVLRRLLGDLEEPPT